MSSPLPRNRLKDISKEIIKVHVLGEIVNGKFIGGVLAKPTMNANIRIINDLFGLKVNTINYGANIVRKRPFFRDRVYKIFDL